MRQAIVKVHDHEAGILTETDDKRYQFTYHQAYAGAPVSLTMPIPTLGTEGGYIYDTFPPFFDGVLPEGGQLEGLLRVRKIDKNDYFSQLLAVGQDLVGAVTVFEE
jgi:serine/threonine-protein kinase HipA